jgi:hypothetical protein
MGEMRTEEALQMYALAVTPEKTAMYQWSKLFISGFAPIATAFVAWMAIRWQQRDRKTTLARDDRLHAEGKEREDAIREEANKRELQLRGEVDAAQEALRKEERGREAANRTLELLKDIDDAVAPVKMNNNFTLAGAVHPMFIQLRTLALQIPNEELRRRLEDVAELGRLHFHAAGLVGGVDNGAKRVIIGATGCAREDIAAWLRGDELPQTNTMITTLLHYGRIDEQPGAGTSSEEFDFLLHLEQITLPGLPTPSWDEVRHFYKFWDYRRFPAPGDGAASEQT